MNEPLTAISQSHLHLLVRVDADTEIGTGHLMRCLALAEACQECGGDAVFVVSEVAPALEERLNGEGFRMVHIASLPGSAEDARDTIAAARMENATWIVADGYRFGSEYQRSLKDAGFSLLVIDDYGHADHYSADIVLNQNIYADETIYPGFEPGTRFLMGTKFALIRRDFFRWADLKREVPPVAKKILVTLGGSDPENVMQQIIGALKRIRGGQFDVILVAGGANPHVPALQKAIGDSPGFTLKQNVIDMAELMAWADIAVSAAGSTCWELAYMKVPCILVVLAPNQRPIAEGLHARGAAISLGTYSPESPDFFINILTTLVHSGEQRTAMMTRQQELVDGRGSYRVIRCMSAR